MRLSDFELTQNEIEGTWREGYDPRTGAPDPDLKLKVASLNSPRYTRMRERMISDAINRKLRGARRTGRMPDIDPEVTRKIDIECYADTILFDWKGLLNDDGTPFECSRANRVEALKSPLFFDMVTDLAGKEAEDREAELGNSETSPPSTSGTTE